MHIMTVGEMKAHFSKALEIVQRGDDVVISFGKKRKKVAVLVPFSRYTRKQKRRLGLLAGKASFSIKDDFKVTNDELLSL
jgi:antitoxin (DNA-binding transcriptional repressor) of toxin-antitoxin stability system